MKKLLILIVIFLSIARISLAADLSLFSKKNIETGAPFVVSVKLNTGGKSINSFDVTVEYPKEFVSFGGYKEEGTISKSWFKQPYESKEGEINFIGLIPNGVEGVYDPDKSNIQAIPIVDLLFLPKKNGEANFSIKNSDIRENDGLGTPFSHKRNSTSVFISLNEKTVNDKQADNEPPLPFTIEFIEASLFSKTPSMVIFSTTDQESGVRKYEVKKGDNNKWREVSSPTTVTRSIFKKNLTIRATDYNGNSIEASIEIPGLVSKTSLFGIILLGIFAYFGFSLYKKRK